MRTPRWTCAGILAVLWLAAGVPATGAEREPLRVRYGHAGLTGIRIEQRTLTYVWHTLKTGPLVPPQSLAAYDKHVAKRALTPEQLRWVTAWADRHHVLRFRKRYPSTDPRSYGAAFQSRLEVRLGRRERTADWDDTSRAREPVKAVQELEAWCIRVTGAK